MRLSRRSIGTLVATIASAAVVALGAPPTASAELACTGINGTSNGPKSYSFRASSGCTTFKMRTVVQCNPLGTSAAGNWVGRGGLSTATCPSPNTYAYSARYEIKPNNAV